VVNNMEFWVYNGRVYTDQSKLDEVLFNTISRNTHNVHSVEVQVQDAYYDGTVDCYNMTEEEFNEFRKDYKVK